MTPGQCRTLTGEWDGVSPSPPETVLGPGVLFYGIYDVFYFIYDVESSGILANSPYPLLSYWSPCYTRAHCETSRTLRVWQPEDALLELYY